MQGKQQRPGSGQVPMRTRLPLSSRQTGSARHLRISVLAVCCLASFEARATLGIYEHGSGIKSLGYGGVSYVGIEETTAISANPAAAILLGDRFDIGSDMLEIKSQTSVDGNAAGPDQSFPCDVRHLFPIPQAGVTLSLPGRWAVGIAALGAGIGPDYSHSPYARFASPAQAQASASAETSLKVIGLSLIAAHELFPGQSVGAGLNLQHESLTLRGADPFAALSEAPAYVTDVGNHGALGMGVTFGWSGRIMPWLSGGLSYRSPTWAHRIGEYSGLLPDHGRLNLPAIYGGGVEFRPAAQWTVALEFQRYDYKGTHAFGNSLDKVFEGYPLGSSNGPGFGWNSQNVSKLGLSYQALPQLSLRAGFIYANQIIARSQTLFAPLAPATSTLHYTAGLSYAINQAAELSGYAALAPGRTVYGHNSIPAAFGGGEVNTEFRGITYGLTYGQRFGKL